MASRGRPKKTQNKENEQVENKNVEQENVKKVVEYKQAPLHIAASIGACFKTGRVGITSLSIQREYDGDVGKGVDELVKCCQDEWSRLEKKGLTQIVPDTYYAEQVNTKEIGDEKKAKLVEDVETIEDAEEVLKSLEVENEQKEDPTNQINVEELDGEEPVEIPKGDDLLDDFDSLVDDFEASLDDVELAVEEETVDPKFNENDEPIEEKESLEACEVLGFDGDDEENIDLSNDGEELELADNSVLCVFDLSPEQQLEELKKRGVSEIDGVPIEKASEPDIVMALDNLLQG